MSRTILLGLVVALLSVTSCERERSVVDYRNLVVAWSTPIADLQSEIAVGDFVEGRGHEIVVREGGTIRILGTDGVQRHSSAVESAPLVLGDVLDFDSDGKDDVVLGGDGNNGARVLVVNGKGEVIHETLGGTLRTGVTRPFQGPDGDLYFIAGSRFAEPPGLIGRASRADQAPDWLVTLGPVPRSVSVLGDYLAVSHQAVGWPVENPQVEALNPEQHSLLVVDKAGATILDQPFGPPVDTVWFDSPQYSRLSLELAGTEQQPVLYVAAERVSELYRGPTEIYSYDIVGGRRGVYQAPRSGPVSMHRLPDANGVIITWSLEGRIEICDADLSCTVSFTLPGAGHDARISAVADIDGRPGLEILVTDGGSLYVLSESLSPLFSFAVDGLIRDVEVAVDDAGARGLAVLATELHYLSFEGPALGTLIVVGETPTTTALVDGRIVPANSPVALEPGAYRVSAAGSMSASRRVVVEAGTLTTVAIPTSRPESPQVRVSAGQFAGYRLVAEVPRLPGSTYLGAHDVLDDAGTEIVLFAPGRGSYEVRARDLTLISTGMMTPGPRAGVIGDADGDGYDDIAVFSAPDGVVTLDVFRGDGVRLHRIPMVMDQGTDLVFSLSDGSTVVAAFITGWGLSPRMAAGFELPGRELRFVNPLAGFCGGGLNVDGSLYLNNYTPSNGVVVEWPDGTVDRDSDPFIHAIRLDGTFLPSRGPVPEGGGGVFFSRFGTRPDGSARILFYVLRNSTFAPGTPAVYEVLSGGSIERRITGPEDASGVLRTFELGGRDYLALGWNTEADGRLYDEDFGIIATLENFASFRQLVSLGDERLARVDLIDGSVELRSLDDSHEQRFGLDVVGVTLLEDSTSGPQDLLVFTAEGVSLYSAR